MKKFSIIWAVLALLLALVMPTPAVHAEDIPAFDAYLHRFDYAERKAMKIKREELLDLYKKGMVQIVDIRFPEEIAAWNLGFSHAIPLNELPDRLDELDKGKLIVTVCPHYGRAEIARLYLTLKGYKARYLSDGLLGLAEYLRGDQARDFIGAIK
jgi:rhodanese-related sulfurtransferase